MYYGSIKKQDIANGIGVRVTLFVSGCTNRCHNCFQPETWDFCYGKPYTRETQEEILQALRQPYIKGLTLLGGEPFELENQPELAALARMVKQQLPQKDIWCYTGFILEKDLVPHGKRYGKATDELLSQIDVLVDGRFDEDLQDITLRFRGSSNQRLIDLIRTKQEKKIILLSL